MSHSPFPNNPYLSPNHLHRSHKKMVMPTKRLGEAGNLDITYNVKKKKKICDHCLKQPRTKLAFLWGYGLSLNTDSWLFFLHMIKPTFKYSTKQNKTWYLDSHTSTQHYYNYWLTITYKITNNIQYWQAAHIQKASSLTKKLQILVNTEQRQSDGREKLMLSH